MTIFSATSSCFIFPIPPTWAHPFHRLLPLFPIFLRPTHSLPFANRTQSVIPAHSVLGFHPLSSPRPSRSFRPTRSTACFLSLSLASVQLGLSRSFRPTQSLVASVPAFTSLFYAFPPLPRLSQSSRLTRSLAISSPFLVLALPPFFWNLGSLFHLSLNPVGHSGPLGSWLPLSLFSHSPCFLCHHSPTSSLPL